MRWVILWGGKGYEMEHKSFDGKWKACDFYWEENIYYKTRGSCNKIIVEVKMENNWFSTKVISYQKWMASLKEKKHEGPKVIFYNEWMVSLTLWKKGQRVTTSRRGWLLWQGGVDGFFDIVEEVTTYWEWMASLVTTYREWMASLITRKFKTLGAISY